MERIKDYEIIEKFKETKDAVIYKGHKQGQTNPVVIKVLKKQFKTASDIARFKQEYEKVMDVDIDGIIRFRDIINYENSMVLITDFSEIEYLYVLLEIQNVKYSIIFKIRYNYLQNIRGTS